MQRLAVLIGVKNFPAAPLNAPLGAPAYDQLATAHECVGDMEQLLAAYPEGGFAVRAVLDPDRDDLASAFNWLVDDETDGPRLVHMISHSRPAHEDQLEIVTSCGRPGAANNVGEWVRQAQLGGAHTLFLVDMCRAGRVANLFLGNDPEDADLRAWVIAASHQTEDAFDCRFSQVVAEVLRQAARDGLDTDPNRRHVSFPALCRRIADEMQRQYGSAQRVTWTRPKHPSLLDLPFLPNPRWRDDPTARAVAALEQPLRPFLEDLVADHEHFRRRAGHHFTGRRAELAELVPWVNGDGPGGLRLLTGSPGAGKSAILGAIACAAHPELVAVAPYIRDGLDAVLWPRTDLSLAAVHARHRRLDELVESLAAQLGITEPEITAATLVQAVTELARQPVIVVDALDECSQASAVQSLLLIPLAHARRQDGSPACRLLVGVRPWWEDFAPLRDIATVIDLDRVDARVLRHDLTTFLHSVLDDPGLASGIAARLTQRPAHELQWGQFLVARRYADYVVRHPYATDLVENTPTSLPEVLELELSDHDNPGLLRSVLRALARAAGQGMPEELLRCLVPEAPEGFLAGEDVRLYLRISSEVDGTGLYRLYHQGLADYLRDDSPVFQTLLATRRDQSGRTSWEHAPHYLKRHAIHHAVEAGAADTLLEDAEFLVHAEPSTLLPELGAATSDPARLAAAVYRASHHLHTTDPSMRRKLLILDALRYGATDLANALKAGRR